MPSAKHLGSKLRSLRRRLQLSQAKMASELGISNSYLNLIENERRPLSAKLLIKLAQTYDLDLKEFGGESEVEISKELLEAFGDPLFEERDLNSGDVRELARNHPDLARAVVHMYGAYRSVRDSAETLGARLSQDLALPGIDRARLPSEEVSDFIQRHMNYFPQLEEKAEELWSEAGFESDDLLHGMTRHLFDSHGTRVQVVKAASDGGAVRRYEPGENRLYISEALPLSSRLFQVVYLDGMLSLTELLDQLAADRELSTPASRRLCRISLANYFAGAVLMPYRPFLSAAQEERYDVELLGNRFSTTFEQICHRLTTLRRPGHEGIPFHFVRVDIAGNISKYFSGSGIQISRFGGSCPRWNLHLAFLTPGQITVQLSRTTDGKAYFCIARTVARQARGYHVPRSIQAITLGCEVSHARGIVYADSLDLDTPEAAVPIGTTCRLCEQRDCEQRVFPPIHQPFSIDERVRGVSFYSRVMGSSDQK